MDGTLLGQLTFFYQSGNYINTTDTIKRFGLVASNELRSPYLVIDLVLVPDSSGHFRKCSFWHLCIFFVFHTCRLTGLDLQACTMLY